MKLPLNWRTTLLAILEAIFLSISAEQLFPLNNKQRAMVITLAVLRATFGYFARDIKNVETK